MTIEVGRLAPRFAAPSPSLPRYTSSAFGGRYTLLVFLPTERSAEQAALGALAANRALFDDANISAFGVLRTERTIALAKDQKGLRWFFDRDGEVSRLFGALTPSDEQPRWVLLDPAETILAISPIEAANEFFSIVKTLPPPDQHAGVELFAPVLVIPRVFEPELCRELIQYYERDGGTQSGVMRIVDGRTVHVIDDYKRRRDTTLPEGELKELVRRRLAARVLPQIRKAFQFNTTYIERYIVSCYDASDGGYFGPHRDNTTPRTEHRNFACSINLNAEEFEGGELRFPEFGKRTYRPPTGGAVVFSCSLLHEATSVRRGRRYAFLPFFYDEAGEKRRLANRQVEGEADHVG